jgi:predicted transcriptional regulator
MIEHKSRALELHRAGASYSEIAAALGTSKTTAYTWVKDAEKDSAVNVQSVNDAKIQSFGTLRTQNTANLSNIRSEAGGISKVKIKEPGYLAEQRQRIAELEAQTQHLAEQLSDSKRKQIERLKRKFQKTQEFITQNNGEVWSVDELYQTAAELENLSDDMNDTDSNIQVWVESHIHPLIELLEEAAESLTDGDLDEGEVFFYED